jgi:tRNA threonylcarbamoyladenosine biosynthesis protein TsaE
MSIVGSFINPLSLQNYTTVLPVLYKEPQYLCKHYSNQVVEFRFSYNELSAAARWFLDACSGCRVVALEGPMGAGKTTFVHALCDEWGVKDVVGSPTFSIINEYKTGSGETVYHMDLYRLQGEEELVAAGVEDALYSGAICLVEWPEKAESILPSDTVYLTLVPLGEKERLLKIRFPH